MKTKIIKKINFLFLILPLFIIIPFVASAETELAETLKGRILLQVEDNGEGWYIPPEIGERIYLGRPADAFSIMRKYGVGMEHSRLEEFLNKGFPSHWKGRIILDVEREGQAYYVSPQNGEGKYLGRPRDALRVMKEEGVGITNKELRSIPVKKETDSSQDTQKEEKDVIQTGEGNTQYNWEHQGEEYQLALQLHDSIYERYHSQPLGVSYQAGEVPSDWKKDVYEMYLDTAQVEDVYSRLAEKMRALAEQNDLTEEEIPELAISFVQSIPYDDSLADKIVNDPGDSSMKYPYEVLYENKGACGGKSFLAVLLFERLGYGTALFEFEKDNHLAAGIKCNKEYSTYGSGYCYVESTIPDYPIGILPGQDPYYFLNGKAIKLDLSTSAEEGENLTDPSAGVIYQKTEGKTYAGVKGNVEQLQKIKQLKNKIEEEQKSLQEKQEKLQQVQAEIKELEQQLRTYQENGQTEEYDELFPTYKSKVEEGKQLEEEYNNLADQYNSHVNEYNNLVNDLY